jgi:LysM repeat protein
VPSTAEPAYAPAVNARLGAMVAVAALLALGSSACGDDSGAADTLPPLITTTTSTTIAATTTTMVTLYEVKSGDSLSRIAQKFNVDQAALMMLNGITNPDHIEAGQVLKLPPPIVAADTTSPSSTAPVTT